MDGCPESVRLYVGELSRLNFITALKGRLKAIRRDELVWFFGGRKTEKRSRKKEVLGMFQRCLSGQVNTTLLP